MNYREVEQALRENKPFKHGSSMSAELIGGTSYDQYRVYSYSTLIYRCCCDGSKSWDQWITPVKYSQTTTKQVNIIRRVKNV